NIFNNNFNTRIKNKNKNKKIKKIHILIHNNGNSRFPILLEPENSFQSKHTLGQSSGKQSKSKKVISLLSVDESQMSLYFCILNCNSFQCECELLSRWQNFAV